MARIKPAFREGPLHPETTSHLLKVERCIHKLPSFVPSGVDHEASFVKTLCRHMHKIQSVSSSHAMCKIH